MPLICYEERRFTKSSWAIIDAANSIIAEYDAQGFSLTLRQLYYQFVARGWLPNKQSEYKRLGDIMNKARLAGEVDWNALEDRTRNVRANPHWDSPAEVVAAAAAQFRFDLWEDQEYRPEVWIEKDALVGVIEGVCTDYDVPYFACRGYNSQSEQWRAGRRFDQYYRDGQQPLVIHLGDHDPSGIDMTRDNEDRLHVFAEGGVIVERIALNIDQVRKYNPPPNPAKETDSRSPAYVKKFGGQSWELDALDPPVIAQLIRDELESVIDDDKWRARKAAQAEARGTLETLSGRWDEVATFLNGKDQT